MSAPPSGTWGPWAGGRLRTATYWPLKREGLGAARKQLIIRVPEPSLRDLVPLGGKGSGETRRQTQRTFFEKSLKEMPKQGYKRHSLFKMFTMNNLALFNTKIYST